jgi:hypothetical protein
MIVIGVKKPGHVRPPRGEPLQDSKEAWRYHAKCMGDLVEDQAQEIRSLKSRLNKAEQKIQEQKV